MHLKINSAKTTKNNVARTMGFRGQNKTETLELYEAIRDMIPGTAFVVSGNDNNHVRRLQIQVHHLMERFDELPRVSTQVRGSDMTISAVSEIKSAPVTKKATQRPVVNVNNLSAEIVENPPEPVPLNERLGRYPSKLTLWINSHAETLRQGHAIKVETSSWAEAGIVAQRFRQVAPVAVETLRVRQGDVVELYIKPKDADENSSSAATKD